MSLESGELSRFQRQIVVGRLTCGRELLSPCLREKYGFEKERV